MYRGGSDRIVYFQYVVNEVYLENHDDAADGTDHDCSEGGNEITSGGDSDQSCQYTV